MTVRALGPGDEAAVEAFLRDHADTTLFLRSNLRKAGLTWSGRAFEGQWTARCADDDGAIAGVACHAWNGMLLVQDDTPAEAARATVVRSGRPVQGLIGPTAMVAAARAALGLADVAASLDRDEVLMTLSLSALIVPRALAAGAIAVRVARAGDLELLAGWRHDYRIEALHEPASDALRAGARADVEGALAGGVLYVAERAGAVVAMTMFNATLPDVVQIGGVYTPPDRRRRGHAQAAVAGSLLDARARGVERAILFADRGNPSSTTAYRRIGFTDAGSYMLLIFPAPVAARLA